MNNSKPKFNDAQLNELESKMKLLGSKVIRIKSTNKYKRANTLMYADENEVSMFIAEDSTVVFDEKYYANIRKIIYEELGVQYIHKLTVYGGGKLHSCSKLFINLRALEIDLSNFDTSSALSFMQMFHGSRINKLICGNLDLDNATIIDSMFNDAVILEIDKPYWNLRKVNSADSMFQHCTLQCDLDLSALDTSNICRMNNIFLSFNCKKLNLSNFNISKVVEAASINKPLILIHNVRCSRDSILVSSDKNFNQYMENIIINDAGALLNYYILFAKAWY